MVQYSQPTKEYLEPHPHALDTYLKIALSSTSENWFVLSMHKLRPRRDFEDIPPEHQIGDMVLVFNERITATPQERAFLQRPLELNKKAVSSPGRVLAAATDTTALLINEAWGERNIYFADEEAELRYKHLVLRFRSQEARATIQAGWKLEKRPVDFLPDFVDHPDRPLADYQRLAVNLSMGLSGYAFFMDKGTGKTATVINRIQNEAKRMDRTMRVLVVCPNQVRHNWKVEFGRFSTLPGRVTILRGGPRLRVRNLTMGIKKDPTREWVAVIAGYDTIAADFGIVTRVPWDLMVIDESHYIRSQKIKRTKAIFAVTENVRDRLALTGSPICNSPMDLFMQLEFLGKGMSGFIDPKVFASFFEESTELAPGVSKILGFKNIPMLQERLARVSFQLTKEEAGLNLPDKVYSTYEVEMTPEQTKVYTDLATKLRAEIEESRAEGTMNRSLEVNHVLTKLLRLAQVTSGYMHLNAEYDLDTGECIAEEEFRHFNPNPKIEAVRDILLDTEPNCKTIIWVRFRQNIKDLQALLDEMGIMYGSYYGSTKEKDRQHYVDEFNKNPKFKVLIAQIATAAEGLDLLGYDKDNPEASDTYCGQEIFVSQDWSAVSRSQAEDRAHRRGTRQSVSIIDLIVPGSIDEEILMRVQGKLEMAADTLDLEEILKNVLD